MIATFSVIGNTGTVGNNLTKQQADSYIRQVKDLAKGGQNMRPDRANASIAAKETMFTSPAHPVSDNDFRAFLDRIRVVGPVTINAAGFVSKG